VSEVVRVGAGPDADELLRLAASLDQMSSHVFAGAIVRAAHERRLALEFPTATVEHAGDGIEGAVGAQRIGVGRLEWVGRDGAHSAEALAIRR
jgi:cation transport ATPase